MNTTENNKAVIRKFLEEVINQNRMDRVDDIVAEDFVELDPLPGQRQGREGLKEVLVMMRAAFPDMHWVVEEMVAEEDKVVTRFTWTGTHLGAFGDRPAVAGFDREGLKNQEIESSLNEVAWLSHTVIIYTTNCRSSRGSSYERQICSFFSQEFAVRITVRSVP